MSGGEERPVYDWQRATPGDAADEVTVEVTRAHLDGYARTQRLARPLASSEVPAVMIRLYAPLRRRELVAQMGASYPPFPTPAIRWHGRILETIRVGDRIRSTTRLAEKFEKNGRRFVRWDVQAHRVGDDQPVAVFGYVNLWELGRPEDRQRGKGSETDAPAQTPQDAPAAAPPRRLQDIVPGARLPSRTWTASMDEIVTFGDFLYPARPENPTRAGNPHIDAEFAKKHIYGAITVDGNQTVAHLCDLVADWLPPGAVTGADTEVDLRFPNPCRQDDVVRLEATVESVSATGARFQVQAHNQAGRCLARGFIATPMPAQEN